MNLHAECVKALSEIAKLYPHTASMILDSLAETSKTWAQEMEKQEVPWQMVAALLDMARKTARANGKQAFSPTLDDLLAEWEREQRLTFQLLRGGKWEEHNEARGNTHYSKELPLLSKLFQARGGAVVCHCKDSKGDELPAQVTEDGTLWICFYTHEYYSNPDPRRYNRGIRPPVTIPPCDFEWDARKTGTAPFPSQTYMGGKRAVNTRAEAPEAPSMEATVGEPRRGLASDEEVLSALKRMGFEVSDFPDFALSFGRYMLRSVPLDLWTNSIVQAKLQKFHAEHANSVQVTV